MAFFWMPSGERFVCGFCFFKGYGLGGGGTLDVLTEVFPLFVPAPKPLANSFRSRLETLTHFFQASGRLPLFVGEIRWRGLLEETTFRHLLILR